jgi:uracil-DNA glycosylase
MDNNQTPQRPGAEVYSPMQGEELPVSAYASITPEEPLETLEVRAPGQDPNNFKPPVQPGPKSFRFTRNRAVSISLVITLIVVLLGNFTALFLLKKNPELTKSAGSGYPTQDISVQ